MTREQQQIARLKSELQIAQHHGRMAEQQASALRGRLRRLRENLPPAQPPVPGEIGNPVPPSPST